MRLIDADKIDYIMEDEEKPNSLDYVRRSHIADEPTVKAIPIEWLENWKKGKTSIEQVVADKIMMDYKYRDYWEKENAID